MITFRAPELGDKAWVDELLSYENSRACEYNFSNIYLLSKTFPQKIARMGDRLLVQMMGKLGMCHLYPAGRGDLKSAVEALQADAKAIGKPFILICITPEQRAALEEACPGKFRFEPDRDGFDYLYDIDRLADLTGKKLHAKRNHINRFGDEHPDWLFEELTEANLDECRAMDEDWYEKRAETADGVETLREETGAVGEALRHFRELKLEGGLIRCEGKVAAFSVGDKLGADAYDVHFEKAYGDMQGAYTVINREMARLVRTKHPEVRYLNREDDMGLEGLRKAKESYYPDILLEKYTAVPVGD